MAEIENKEVALEEQAAAPKKSPAKKPAAKKAAKKTATKEPLYINGRYVPEKALPEKPKAGSKPYELTDKKIKVTLVKSTNGCLDEQKKTVEALGLKKIRSFNVLPDNSAIRGMIFKVKHLVTVEEVK